MPAGLRTVHLIALLPNGRGGLYRGCITIAGQEIVDIAAHAPERTSTGSGADQRPETDHDLDFTPHVALPGFIDLHLNGAFGHDFTSDPPTMWSIASGLASQGVTAFAPTIITSPPEQRRAAYDAILERPAGYSGPEPLGLHIEGPVLATAHAGTHPRANLIVGGETLTSELAEQASVVALVTLAPEVEGAIPLIARLSEAGIAVSLGHSGATSAETSAAFAAGARALTHLFNGMAPLHHRQVGIVGAGLLHPEVWVSLIADGEHLSGEALQLAWRLAGSQRILLVTDAMAGMGALPGIYRLGDVRVRCARAPRADGGGLAGSLLTMPEAARHLRRQTGATWDELALVTSTNAASLLGDCTRGRLAAGMRADIVIVDANLEPVATIIAGSISYQRPDRIASSNGRATRVAVGVDIGGSYFKAGIFDGAKLREVHRGQTGRNRPASEVLREVRRAIDRLLAAAAANDVVGIGIACPGIVNAGPGTVIEATNLGWRDIDILGGVGSGLTPPVSVEHDVYLGALAEWETGAGVGAESMLYISVGTGVASQLFTRSGTYRGRLNLAGEMGIIPVGPDAVPLESLASARAMSEAYHWQTGRTVDVEQIVAARKNDAVSERVWTEGIEALAWGIAAAICLQDPQIVVVGGGVSNAGGQLLDALAPRVAELVIQLRDPPPIVRATHGAHSGIVGAALHAGLNSPGGR